MTLSEVIQVLRETTGAPIKVLGTSAYLLHPKVGDEILETLVRVEAERNDLRNRLAAAQSLLARVAK